MDILLKLLVVVVLVALNAFFVAAEFGIVSARRMRLEQMARSGVAKARLAQELTDDIDRYVAACQLGITLASLLLGWVGESTLAAIIEPPIEHGLSALLGQANVAPETSSAVSHIVGVVISLLLITAMHIVLGEQVPKVYSLRAPERTTIWVSRPLSIFNRVFSPLIRFLDWATNVILRMLGMREPTGHHAVPTVEDLKLMVEATGQGGMLEEDEQTMIFNVISFADRPASQVMIPRPQVETIDYRATVGQFLERFSRTGHTRFPVIGASIDDVRGIISAKDLLLAQRTGTISLDDPIEGLIRPAHFVPSTKHIGPLLEEMREQQLKMVVLVDEYGGMAGTVTLEDIVEEIVGSLRDELDKEEDDVKAIDERTLVVDAHLRIDEVNEELGLHIPAGEYETLAGFLLEQLGRFPVAGESIAFDGATLTVVEMEGQRIERIQVRR